MRREREGKGRSVLALNGRLGDLGGARPREERRRGSRGGRSRGVGASRDLGGKGDGVGGGEEGEGAHEEWSNVSKGPLWAHGYAAGCRPWSAAPSALASGTRGLPNRAEYHAKVPAETSERATAVRFDEAIRAAADCFEQQCRRGGPRHRSDRQERGGEKVASGLARGDEAEGRGEGGNGVSWASSVRPGCCWLRSSEHCWCRLPRGSEWSSRVATREDEGGGTTTRNRPNSPEERWSRRCGQRPGSAGQPGGPGAGTGSGRSSWVESTEDDRSSSSSSRAAPSGQPAPRRSGTSAPEECISSTIIQLLPAAAKFCRPSSVFASGCASRPSHFSQRVRRELRWESEWMKDCLRALQGSQER